MFVLIFSPVLQELKEVGKEQSKVEAELPANVSKNRYAHVLPCKCCLLPSPQPPGWELTGQCSRTGSPCIPARVSAWLLSWEQEDSSNGPQFPFSSWRLKA